MAALMRTALRPVLLKFRANVTKAAFEKRGRGRAFQLFSQNALGSLDGGIDGGGAHFGGGLCLGLGDLCLGGCGAALHR